MKQHPFGKTALQVTPIGLGLAALGRPGYINLGHAQDMPDGRSIASLEAHTHDVLDAAWEMGIRYFDAARSYGRAEQFLGSWLTARKIAPADVTVGSKWGYTYTADWQVNAEVHEVKEHSLAVLQRQIGESRALLGQYLNLYQIHSATLDSGVLDNQPVLDQLARLKAGGLVIGLSLSGAKQADTLAKALTIRYDGELLFGSVQATWNLLETSIGPVLNEAHQTGLAVIVKEALANGRLTPRNQNPNFTPQRALLEQIAAQKETTIDALALSAVLNQPWATVVLSGAATTEQLRSNVAALAVNWGEETAEALAPLAESPATYWQIRSNLNWN
ncbi:MAG: aldo/keto reductase [Candidatus Promineifilaceae bacterium]